MHKFKIGMRLFPTRLDVPDGAYVVIKRLPMRDGEFEYQIKSLTERDERVVRGGTGRRRCEVCGGVGEIEPTSSKVRR